MSTYHFGPLNLGYTEIPAFTLSENDFLRIEVDFHLNLQREQIVRAIQRNGQQVGFMSLAPLKKQPLLERIFRAWSVEAYFRQCGMREVEIEDFFQIVQECQQPIKRNQPLKDLNTREQKAVFLQSAIHRQKTVLIDTAGMYVNILYLTYQVIKVFRANGGTCLEIAYPPFMTEDKLKHFIEPNPRTIRLLRKQG